jgi:hypothetical protein
MNVLIACMVAICVDIFVAEDEKIKNVRNELPCLFTAYLKKKHHQNGSPKIVTAFLCVLFSDSKPQGQDPPPFVNPFNQGNSLFETPYSGSINAMGGGSGGFMQGMMTMNGGGGRNGLPSMFMKDGKLQMGHQQCLKNIVCPQYCHEIDEDGCERCPCGPGNSVSSFPVVKIIVPLSKSPIVPQLDDMCNYYIDWTILSLLL